MTAILIAAVIALIIGGVAGYAIFRYVLTGIYKKKMADAEKDADVIKEKKLLEVKERFLNKKNELDKEVQSRSTSVRRRLAVPSRTWSASSSVWRTRRICSM